MGGKIGRGSLVALAAVAIIALRGGVDWLAGYGLRSPFMTAALVMTLPGAFLASLPGRIRHRGEKRVPTTWRGCAACFLGGVGLMLGAGMAQGGDGRMLTGLCQGSVSAYAFWLVSGISAWVAAYLAQRGARA